MSEVGLHKLTRLGYRFWSPREQSQNLYDKGMAFYVLDNKTLITGKLKEFKKYPRIVPSISRILGLTDKEIRQVDTSESLANEFNLVIDFGKGLSFKAKKNIKFDSLNSFINDKELKKSLYKEIQGLN